MKVKRISAVTIFTKDMEDSFSFYSHIPGFKLTFGGSNSKFTTFRVSSIPEMYLNLEYSKNRGCDFGRIIFYTDDVDGLYKFLKDDVIASKLGKFETKPADASWGERFFHMRDPDGYQIAFAKPLTK